MKKVAKIILIDPMDNYLIMYRNNHPVFGNDPDLPGGTLEGKETSLETMLREVKEEIGVDIDKNLAKEVYSGTGYSNNGTHYSLFIAKLDKQPEITISWEHSSYEWIDYDELLKKSKNAMDTYMHMVANELNKHY